MNWTKLTRTAAPASQVVSVEDVKQHLAIAHSDEDTYLSVLIDVATDSIDGPNGVGLALITQSWRMSIDHLSRSIELPLGPVQSVDSISFEGTTLDPSSYTVDLDLSPARVYVGIPLCGSKPGCVNVNFTAGYGDSGDDVPADLKHAIRLLVGHLYNNREATSEATINEVPLAFASILSRYL